MGAFEFDKCCFCVDLKTGCFIIGYLSLISYVGLAILSIVGIMLGGVIAADEKNPDNKTGGIAIMAVAGLMLLFTILLLTFIIVLLVGLHKNKPGHVKAYLIYACIYIGVTVVMFISSAATGSNTGGNIAQNIFSIILSIYFVLVIRSQYLVMKRPERGPAIYSSA